MRTHRARRRLLRLAPPLPERRLLYRAHLSVDGLPCDHVPGPFRDSTHLRMDRAVGRNAARLRAENLAPPPGLPGPRLAQLRPPRPPHVARLLFAPLQQVSRQDGRRDAHTTQTGFTLRV